ncbi:MAG: glycosyltransferase [Methylocella sp.]
MGDTSNNALRRRKHWHGFRRPRARRRGLREPTLDSFAEELSIYLSNPELVVQRGRNARQHVERNYSKTRHFTILRNVINRAAAEVNGYVLPRLRTLPERNSTGDVGGRRV